jgi:hypothetical protein
MKGLFKERVSDIQLKLNLLKESRSLDENIKLYFTDLGKSIIKLNLLELAQEEKNINSTNKIFESIYKNIVDKECDINFGNPDYTSRLFGADLGLLFTCLYNDTRKLFKYYVLKEDKLFFTILNMYLSMLEAYVSGQDSYDQLLVVYRKFKFSLIDLEIAFECDCNYNYLENRYLRIAEQVVSNKEALSLYGEYISENEIILYEKINSMSDESLRNLADVFVNAYILGFKVDNKDIGKRSIVRLIGSIGQEKLLIKIVEVFREHNLKTIISEMTLTPINRQLDYDLKNSDALIFDQSFAEFKLEILEENLIKYKETVDQISGDAVIEKFGEKPFEPIHRENKIKLDDIQTRINMKYENDKKLMMDTYIPEEETSYCLMALPTAEIGENFSEIFDNIITINSLKNEDYEPIQQLIIDELDQGTHILLKGKGTNQTDIKVALQALKNPEKETNFLNCGADVNIPIGEVFTTPQLKGTEGILHIEQVYLDEIVYKNLWFKFKDGYIQAYNCSNFPDESDCKMMIEDNLLKSHKTLPMGEFAIGTNTLAYMVARKLDLMDKLPILIAEKLGPHMAIGDTCYSWREDAKIYSLHNGKEIVAKDNEHSIVRHHDLQAAYTNQHVDITIPYHDLAYIKVLKADGRQVSIIENGRFVLNGTEFLNIPFEEGALDD